MSRWTISPFRLLVLGFGVLVILLLVVLPDVDPLDTAFHRGTAPVALHAQATSAPAVLSLAVPFHFVQNAGIPRRSHEAWASAVYLSPDSLSILYHSLRC